MKKPKMIKVFEEPACTDGGKEVIELQEKGVLDEYGFEMEIQESECKLKAGDIVVFKHPDITFFLDCRTVMTFGSGKQVVTFTYKKVELNK